MQPSTIYRRDQPAQQQVLATLDELGVSASPSFIDFFVEYEGPFGSSRTSHEMCCLTSPGDESTSIAIATRAAREFHQFPTRFLVISNLVGGSVLVYDTESDRVFDVDFEGGDVELKEGRLPPRFESFHDFLAWYFVELAEGGV